MLRFGIRSRRWLILKPILARLPEVTFYWGGYGKYTERILKELEPYPNFHYLGKLRYPDDVRQLLTQTDIYALITGLDMLPRSLKEAMSMSRPAIATNVGGISEVLQDSKTGFLVREGTPEDVTEKILYLLKHPSRQPRWVLAVKPASWNASLLNHYTWAHGCTRSIEPQ